MILHLPPLFSSEHPTSKVAQDKRELIETLSKEKQEVQDRLEVGSAGLGFRVQGSGYRV